MPKGIYEHKQGPESSHYKHGKRGTRLYRIWANMKNRCKNPNSNRAHIYVAHGITVCDEWKNDFQAFYDWAMSHGYSDELTLDRINNDGNYEPSNCRWVTYHEQNINKALTTHYAYNGITFCQCEVYTLFGVKRNTFTSRLKRGLSIGQALGKE